MPAIKITAVVGARPNFMKMAALIHEISSRPRFSVELVHTGQHYSRYMSESFFEDLGMPLPDFNLGVGGGTHTTQTAEIMRGLEPVFSDRRPALVLVVGDVNSTLAAALVAAKMGIRIAHVEAGLRSFDPGMPEEINRKVTDVLSDFLFASEPSGVANLIREGVCPDKIFLAGNVMIDTLLRFREKARESPILDTLSLKRGEYAVVTLHRPSNVDDPDRLGKLLAMLSELSRHVPVVFPIHPRTRKQVERFGLAHKGLLLTDPLGYLDFLRLMSEAEVILTDSGGIQEETTYLGVPCLTMRENTERPSTITLGTNTLVGSDHEKLLRAVDGVMAGSMRRGTIPPLWDGKAGTRIVECILSAV
jgi:UDP-N-acetylglucosamine 2-epimerase (non-hydrolysing)